MSGQIFHEFNGTILTITSDSGTSSADLQGGKGDTGPRGAQGPAGIIVNPDGTIDTSNYGTETYVNEKIAQVEAGSVDLSNYYTKTQTTALLDNYATKTYVQEQIEAGSVDLTNYYTKAQVDAKIPDTSTFATKTWVEGKGYLTEHQSLTEYAKKSEIPTKTSQLTNNSGYLTEHQSLKTINGESIVGTGNITISGGSADLSNYYTKTEIDNKGYLTEHQSLANYALKTEIPDVSQYQTATQVQTLIDNALGVIENGTY